MERNTATARQGLPSAIFVCLCRYLQRRGSALMSSAKDGRDWLPTATEPGSAFPRLSSSSTRTAPGKRLKKNKKQTKKKSTTPPHQKTTFLPKLKGSDKEEFQIFDLVRFFRFVLFLKKILRISSTVIFRLVGVWEFSLIFRLFFQHMIIKRRALQHADTLFLSLY